MGSIFDPDRILVRRSGMLGRIIDPINHFSIFLYPPMLDGQVGALCSWEITNHRVGRIRAVIFERWMGLNILFDGPISMAIEIFAIQKLQSLKSRFAGGLKKSQELLENHDDRDRLLTGNHRSMMQHCQIDQNTHFFHWWKKFISIRQGKDCLM